MNLIHLLILVSFLTLECGAASTGLVIQPASQTSANSVLSTNYCLRRRAFQPGIPGVTHPKHFSNFRPDINQLTRPVLDFIPGVAIINNIDTWFGHTKIHCIASFDGPTSTPLETTWIPTRTSGSVTVETVTFSCNLLFKPPPRSEKDVKSSLEQVHDDFLGFVPKMKSASSIFDNLDNSVSTAGAGLFGLFHSAFSVAADIGTDLGSIGLSELDEIITDIEPLLSNLNLPNGNAIMGYSGAILDGIGIGEDLRELVDLANKPPPDTRPTPEPTTQATPTTNPSYTSTSTGTSTSSSASATETTKLYSISTKEGTKLEDYYAFINGLPDEEIRGNAMIRAVVENSAGDDSDDDEHSVIPNTLEARVDPDLYPMLNLAQQPISPGHLNLISQGPRNAVARRSQPTLAIPDYLLSPKAGEGITIFVIDTGINPAHPATLPATKPNPAAGLGGPRFVPYIPDSDQVMSESKNHGSCVASLATGRVYGVAKRARLVPVKYTNSRGSAVLNFSQGFGHLRGEAWQKRRDLMEVLLKTCWKNDIVTVIAAGNEGEDPFFDLSKDIPACLGKPTNPLITVGACDIAGNRTPLTSRDRGLGGSITTSAQGDNEVRCVAPGSSGSQTQPGTSMAAPQIAGLAAYFMSLPRAELPEAINADTQTAGTQNALGTFLGPSLTGGKFIGPDLHVKGKVSQAVKDYIGRMAYKRDLTHPDAVNVGYNGVEEGLCNVVWPNTSFKRKRGGIHARADEYGLSPVVVSGVLDPTASYQLVTSMSSVLSGFVCYLIVICYLDPTVPSTASTPEPFTVPASTISTLGKPTPSSSTPASLNPDAVPAVSIPTPVPPRVVLPTALPSPTSTEDEGKPCYAHCYDNGDIIG
ncbi:peptidase S8/S53 domain-containing protein [Leptodontidium sp. MPI-SDFR-AT-0119]|nr:peptidase S8/S53 domain-containing protein [Leptodontidium sp. MPI-SDFR-AT-0119]